MHIRVDDLLSTATKLRPFVVCYRMEYSGEVSRGEKMLYAGTDPELYITEYTLVYEE